MEKVLCISFPRIIFSYFSFLSFGLMVLNFFVCPFRPYVTFLPSFLCYNLYSHLHEKHWPMDFSRWVTEKLFIHTYNVDSPETNQQQFESRFSGNKGNTIYPRLWKNSTLIFRVKSDKKIFPSIFLFFSGRNKKLIWNDVRLKQDWKCIARRVVLFLSLFS